MLVVYAVPVKKFYITHVFGHKEYDVTGILGVSQNIRYLFLFFPQCPHMSLWTLWSSLLGMAEV